MKKIILTAFLAVSFCSHAQLGGLLNKAKEKISKTQTSNSNSNSSAPVTPATVGEKDNPVVATAKPDIPTDGVTSPTHQKYMGKIVFASKDASISKGKEVENEFLNKVVIGEPAVFRVYMDNSLCNYLKGHSFSDIHGKYKIVFSLDGTEVHSAVLTSDSFKEEAKQKWTTWRGAIKSPDSQNYLCLDEFNTFLRVAEAKLTPGDHKFKIEIHPYMDYPDKVDGPVVATGEIILTAKASIIDANDPRVCMPKALLNDKTLEPKILAAFKAKGWQRDAREIRITSPKWNIVRNKVTGVILRRVVEAAVGFSKDGKCAYELYNFYQDYDGSNYQSDVYLEGIGNKYDISCKCLKP